MALLLLAGLTASMAAQGTRPKAPTPARDTVPKEKVNIDKADVFLYEQGQGRVVQKLIGNVELRQDSVYMYCDTAIIEDNINVFATGSVIIQHGDSLSIFADSLRYNGQTRIANLFGNVTLNSVGGQQLFTDQLRYDLNTKTATYTTGATLVDGTTQLTSRRGDYLVGQRMALFKDSVVVIDPQFTLRADSMRFNTETKVVKFTGPTLITAEKNRIYCEDGFYDTANNLAEFAQDAQFIKGEQRARADIIRYDGAANLYTLEGDARYVEGSRRATADVIRYDERNDKTFLVGNAYIQDSLRQVRAGEIEYDAKRDSYRTKGRSQISDPPQLLAADEIDYLETSGIAKGNVVWQDTSAKLTIVCELADYRRDEGYLKASGGQNNRPLLISNLEGDSLFMTADTLLSLREDSLRGDSSRLLLAYQDVRIFKSNLQAVCDSLAYSSQDSVFRFFYDPIIWSDTTQFTADTIHMRMANERIDRILLFSNSFIINSPDEVFYNQIKGRYITAFFDEGRVRQMDVEGNAESVYYARDEGGGYIGVNKTVCSDMVIRFAEGQIDRIKFIAEPQGTFSPMRQVDHDKLRIPGFQWETQYRPMSKEDLYADWEKRQRSAAPEVVLPVVRGDAVPVDRAPRAAPTESREAPGRGGER